MKRFSLKIRPELKEAFREEHRELCLKRAKVVLLLALVFNLIFTATDYFFSQGHYVLFATLRTLFSLQIVASLLFLSFFRRVALRMASGVILGLSLSIGAIMSIMCFYTGGFGSLYASGFLFVLLTIGSAMPWHPGYQITVSALFEAFYLSQVFFLGWDSLAKDLFSYNWMVFSGGFLSSITAYMQYRLTLELKEAQAEVVRSETLSAVGQLAAGVAHNINTFMSGADMALTLLTERTGDPSLTPIAKTAHESVRSTKALVSMLEGFSQKNREGLRAADVQEACEEVIRLLTLDPKASDIAIHRDYTLSSSIVCDPQQIKSALFNLLKNAVQSGAENLWIRTAQDPNGVLISVCDDGRGIPEKIQSRIFEPFFTTKDVGEGTGLGLWMAYRCAREHKGNLTVTSRSGGGSEFRLSLPLGS